MAQANREVVDPLHPNMGTVAAKERDFTGMNPHELYGSKVEEEHQEVIEEIYKILDIIGVTAIRKAESVT